MKNFQFSPAKRTDFWLHFTLFVKNFVENIHLHPPKFTLHPQTLVLRAGPGRK
jgi:hypothetical protein